MYPSVPASRPCPSVGQLLAVLQVGLLTSSLVLAPALVIAQESPDPSSPTRECRAAGPLSLPAEAGMPGRAAPAAAAARARPTGACAWPSPAPPSPLSPHLPSPRASSSSIPTR